MHLVAFGAIYVSFYSIIPITSIKKLITHLPTLALGLLTLQLFRLIYVSYFLLIEIKISTS